MSEATATLEQSRSRGRTAIAVAVLLLLTAAIALAWSHVKLLSQDEMFVLQTDSVSSVGELVRIQRSYPISLDPLFFHLLAHACTKILGPTPLALRLPSILGFLLMQLCLFFITRRIAGPRAALVAMAFPAMTATLYYAPEARPYGLLLGLYALTFLCWQTAVRRSSHRTGALVLLAAAILLTLNTHYFGVLVLVPLSIAELTRIVQRRRIDIPVVLAIFIGMAGVVFTLPFQHAAGEFRKHYYNAGEISFRAITQAYRSLFLSYTEEPLRTQQLEAALLVLFALALIVLCARRLHRKQVALPAPEFAFLLALAALPLFGVLLAIFVTHSIEVRYVLAAIIAVAVFFAVAVEPWLRTRASQAAITVVLGLGILLLGLVRVRKEQMKSSSILAQLVLPPSLKKSLLALPDSHLYIQDMGHFEVASYYEPDPAVRSRIALLYSHNEELKYDGHDTASLTAEHMRHFTGLTIVSYAQLKALPGEHMLVLYHSGWDWTDQALAADHAKLTPLGRVFEGDAVIVMLQARAPEDGHHE